MENFETDHVKWIWTWSTYVVKGKCATRPRGLWTTSIILLGEKKKKTTFGCTIVSQKKFQPKQHSGAVKTGVPGERRSSSLSSCR